MSRALVTGGTGGIGAAICRALAAQKTDIAIHYCKKQRNAFSLAEELETDFGVRAVAVCADVADSTSVKKMFDVIDSFGGIDILINNAGVAQQKLFTDITEADWRHMTGVDLDGVFFCCQEAVKLMQQSGGGSIVLVGSTHHRRGNKDRTAYACAKGALYTLSNHIGKHYAEDKIRCNYLVMGWTPTDGELALRKSQGMSEQELRKEADECEAKIAECPFDRSTPSNDSGVKGLTSA